jgi:hypothetical protein
LSVQSSATEVAVGVVAVRPVGTTGAVTSAAARLNSPKRKTRAAGFAVVDRFRWVAKIPAKVCGVPPVCSATPEKKAAGTVNEPTLTGAAVPIWYVPVTLLSPGFSRRLRRTVEVDTERLPVLISSPAVVPFDMPPISRASCARIWVVEVEASTSFT